MNHLLEVEVEKTINCSKSIAFWNYWDHEHLDIVHAGYSKSDIMYDSNNFLFRIDRIRIPIFSFMSIKTPVFMVQHDENTLFTYAIQYGFESKTTITIEEIDKNNCKINMNYKFHVEGWRIIFKPILKSLIKKWNERVWIEDLPIKLRRQKMLEMNFMDFHGLPINSSERYNGIIKDLKLPIVRPKNSSRDQHIFKK
tara:strand:+ start:221 stop:811 length:591 start_codon:yes stop_codon:yes gene_type:complete